MKDCADSCYWKQHRYYYCCWSPLILALLLPGVVVAAAAAVAFVAVVEPADLRRKSGGCGRGGGVRAC